MIWNSDCWYSSGPRRRRDASFGGLAYAVLSARLLEAITGDLAIVLRYEGSKFGVIRISGDEFYPLLSERQPLERLRKMISRRRRRAGE